MSTRPKTMVAVPVYVSNRMVVSATGTSVWCACLAMAGMSTMASSA